MHSVLGLQVHLRVPVRVEDDDGVCSLKVEAESSCAGAEQEDIELTIGLIEQFHAFFSVFCLGGAIESEVSHACELEIGLHDVHEVGHLREDEQSVGESAQFGEDAIDELELT